MRKKIKQLTSDLAVVMQRVVRMLVLVAVYPLVILEAILGETCRAWRNAYFRYEIKRQHQAWAHLWNEAKHPNDPGERPGATTQEDTNAK